MAEDKKHIPTHLGIIMVGNERWARDRGLPVSEGYREGAANLRRTLHACIEIGIKILTVYAYSGGSGVWPEGEASGARAILESILDNDLADLHERGVQVRHLGSSDGISAALQRRMRDAHALTENNQTLILNVAFNYNGREEILEACRRMLDDGVEPDEVDEELFGQYLPTASLPDPDLIIRTGGESRASNILLWQGAYAEYYVTPTYWPDFDRSQLDEAVGHYGQRERRFGVLK